MNIHTYTRTYIYFLINARRSLFFSCVFIYRILKVRKDLRVIISSATLDAQSIKDFFSPYSACIMSIEGRTYPVDKLYLAKPAADYLAAAADAVLEVHAKEPPGDILVFLPGQEEIEAVLALLLSDLGQRRLRQGTAAGGGWRRRRRSTSGKRPPELELLPLPLYAGLPYEEQMRAFEAAPRGTRKAILATNIAETSVTISGVVYVIDSGFSKVSLNTLNNTRTFC